MSSAENPPPAVALEVHLHGELVGRLERLEGARLRFQYASQWVAGGGRPLSLSLPVRAEPFDHEETEPFFAGLLPEGEFLRSVARSFGVSASNAFSLLTEIGGECAGAVTLVPPGSGQPEQESPYWIGGPVLGEFLRELRSKSLHVGADGRACQRSSVSPRRRPSNLPTGGHLNSPLVAIGSPRFVPGERIGEAEAVGRG